MSSPNGYGVIDIVQQLLSNSSVTSTSMEIGTQLDELGKRIASSGIQLASNGVFSFPTVNTTIITANAVVANVVTANTVTANTLVVNGLSTLTGNATLSGFINVAGLSTFTGNASFSGFVNAASTLQVAGLTTHSGNLTQVGNATFSGFVNTASSLNVAGISQHTGNATFGGFVNISSTLQVSGNVTPAQIGSALIGSFAFSPAQAFFGTNALNQVASNANFALVQGAAGGTSLNSPTGINLNIGGVPLHTINTTAFVIGTNTTFNGAFANIAGTLQVTGQSMLSNTSVSGILNVSANSTFFGTVAFGSGASITVGGGNPAFTGSFKANGVANTVTVINGIIVGVGV